jgi:hypothetical protein
MTILSSKLLFDRIYDADPGRAKPQYDRGDIQISQSSGSLEIYTDS